MLELRANLGLISLISYKASPILALCQSARVYFPRSFFASEGMICFGQGLDNSGYGGPALFVVKCSANLTLVISASWAICHPNKLGDDLDDLVRAKTPSSALSNEGSDSPFDENAADYASTVLE